MQQSNLWGLREVQRFKWPAWNNFCSCINQHDGDKSADSRNAGVILVKGSTPVLAITLPPEPIEKDILSPQNSPSVCRISPDHDIQLPPRSSGSESSGYFTPPPETQQAFVKLDNIEEPEPEEEAVQQHRNSVDSLSNGTIHLEATNNKPLQSQFSASSAESFATEEEYEEKPAPASNNSTLELEEVTTPSKHATPTSLDELDFIENGPNLDLLVNKSKSVADFKQFLPDINRKNINSAPPLNDNENVVNIFEIPLTPMTPRKIALPGSAECLLDAEIKEVEVNNHKPKILTRRFSRCQSKRSISNKSLTRQDSTNNNSARPATKPKEALSQALGQMESNEWEITVQGLQALTKIIRHHPEIVEAQIHSVCVALAKHIKNLRSQVSRTACLTATELFSTCKRGIDMELEEVAGPLLQRTADTNRFLRADANSTLDIMCDLLPANRVISVITGRGCCHQNAVVRAASARLLADLVTRFGPDKTMQLPKEIRDRILLAGANALTDGNLDARKQAKSMMSVLVGHQHFQRALLDAVPQHVLRHIAKTLNTLKPHSVT